MRLSSSAADLLERILFAKLNARAMGSTPDEGNKEFSGRAFMNGGVLQTRTPLLFPVVKTTQVAE